MHVCVCIYMSISIKKTKKIISIQFISFKFLHRKVLFNHIFKKYHYLNNLITSLELMFLLCLLVAYLLYIMTDRFSVYIMKILYLVFLLIHYRSLDVYWDNAVIVFKSC